MIGTYLLNQITDLSKNYKIIKEVRGVGLMIGIEFKPQCKSIALNLMEKGLLVSCTAMHVIRLVPPLILTRVEADQILSALQEVLDEDV